MADCYVAALRILGYRFNSEAERRRKLRAKRFDDATIAETIEQLRDEKWLEDERFAAAYVRTRVLKGIGPPHFRARGAACAKVGRGQHRERQRDRADVRREAQQQA